MSGKEKKKLPNPPLITGKEELCHDNARPSRGIKSPLGKGDQHGFEGISGRHLLGMPHLNKLGKETKAIRGNSASPQM